MRRLLALTWRYSPGGIIAARRYRPDPRNEAVIERLFYRDEVDAVLALEAEGVRCPSTFDGGAYLRECAENWIAAAREARR